MGLEARPASGFAVWVHAARPKTLWAGVAPVLIGTAVAHGEDMLHLLSAVVALACAVLIQVGTNYSNDYSDFIQGADTEERVGPLRVTQAGLVPPRVMLRATVIVFAAAFVAGLYLVWRGGWPILAVGVASILSGIFYTTGRKSLGYLGLGDLFVLIFFGPVAVGGTFYVQALVLPPWVLLAGMAPGFLAVAILLANNIRDVDQDRLAGKRTLVVRLGRRVGAELYAACLVAAGSIPLLLVMWTGTHGWALAATAVLPVGWPQYRRLVHEIDPVRLNPVLGATARLLLLYSVAFSIGWLLGA